MKATTGRDKAKSPLTSGGPQRFPATNSKWIGGAIAIVGMVIGFFIGQGSRSLNGSVPELEAAHVSVFESEALGFLNWFRIEGRSEISHDELIRNLRILESRAIRSGKLVAFKSQEAEAVSGNR